MRYHVKKNKMTRISYRMVGILFILVAVAQIFAVMHMQKGSRVLLGMMAVFLIFYGGYLFKMSFRRQAYDMVYEFEEAGMVLHFHNGEEKVPYAEIEDIEIMAPDPNLPYRIIRIKIKGIHYVLPFADNIELCEKIFQYVYARMDFPDAENKPEL